MKSIPNCTSATYPDCVKNAQSAVVEESDGTIFK